MEPYAQVGAGARLGAQLGCPAGRGSCVSGPLRPFSLWDLTNHLLIHVLTQEMFIEHLLCGPECDGVVRLPSWCLWSSCRGWQMLHQRSEQGTFNDACDKCHGEKYMVLEFGAARVALLRK